MLINEINTETSLNLKTIKSLYLLSDEDTCNSRYQSKFNFLIVVNAEKFGMPTVTLTFI